MKRRFLPVAVTELALTLLALAAEPKEVLLWDRGAPGSEGKAGPDPGGKSRICAG